MRGALNRRTLVSGSAALAATLAIGRSVGAEGPAERSTDTLVVNANGTRLRSGAGTSYGVVASLGKGTEVRYLANGGSANGHTWYKVKVLSTSKEGFVASSLLSAPGTSGGNGGNPGFPANVVVTSGPLRLRQYPGTSSAVLATLAVGTSGWLTQETSSWVDGHQWFEVTFLVNGRYLTGHVSASFIQRT